MSTSLDSYERDAMRRRVRSSRVGRAMLVLSVPLVLLAVFGFDNVYWERVPLEAMGWRGVALVAWAAALLVARPGLAHSVRAEHGLEAPEPSSVPPIIRLLILPAALLFEWWVSDFTPGSVLGVMYLVLLAVSWQHLARDGAIAAAMLSSGDG